MPKSPIMRYSTILIVTLILLPGVAVAGVGQGSSQPTLVDTLAPQIHLAPLPEHFWVHGGDQVFFQWASLDQNPGNLPHDFLATVWIDGVVFEQNNWHEDHTGGSWTWLAPELQTADCHLEVFCRDIMGNSTLVRSEDFTVLLSTTEVTEVPQALGFSGPFPNPFNPSCTLDFNLPRDGAVNLTVFDARGCRVQSLWQGELSAGSHRMRWDGTDHQGRPQPGGVYFFVLEADQPSSPERMKLIRKATLIP